MRRCDPVAPSTARRPATLLTMPGRSPITLCGSISHHPAGLGAALHNAGYAALALPFTYVPFGVRDLGDAVRGMRALGIRGLGVSMPFKVEIIPHLDELAPLARQIGAVNTVVNDDGLLTGHNTDAEGALAALREEISPRGRRVLLLGAGGAARAVAHSLAANGAHLRILSRNPERARELALPLAAEWGDLSLLPQCEDFEILVHSTPVGMVDHPGLLIPAQLLDPRRVIFDLVYKPPLTPLVLAARQRGCRVVTGERMLLHQAYRQFELYTGRPAPK